MLQDSQRREKKKKKKKGRKRKRKEKNKKKKKGRKRKRKEKTKKKNNNSERKKFPVGVSQGGEIGCSGNQEFSVAPWCPGEWASSPWQVAAAVVKAECLFSLPAYLAVSL